MGEIQDRGQQSWKRPVPGFLGARGPGGGRGAAGFQCRHHQGSLGARCRVSPHKQSLDQDGEQPSAGLSSENGPA